MSDMPLPPKPDNTALYVVLGVGGGVLLMCIAPSIIVVVCLAAIQLLGKNASVTFQTVAASIGTTGGPPNVDVRMNQLEAKTAADQFVTCLLDAQYDKAYARTSGEFSQRTSPQALRKMCDAQPLFRQRDDLSYSLEPVGWGNPKRQTFKVTWMNPDDQKLLMTVELVSDDEGDWQVNRCTIP